MVTKYFYASTEYATESEAQDAVNALKLRLDNNPTDWMRAKEITGSADTGWTLLSTPLTDAQLLNPSADKTYMAYSYESGENEMPLTASELTVKRDSYRTLYANAVSATTIFKVTEEEIDAPPVPYGVDSENDVIIGQTVEQIQTNTDMSGYV